MKKNLIKALISIIFLGFISAGHAADEWSTDYSKALKTASEKNMPLLLAFTGSDWCPPCMALEREVFSKKPFLEFASKNFVMVELDFPKNKQIPENLTKQNQSIASKYKVEGFPSIIIIDKNEKVLERMTGYENYNSTMDFLKKALKKTGKN